MTAHDAASGQSIFELTASDLEDLPQELLKELRLRHKKRAARNRRAQVEVTEEMVERLAKHMCREEWKHQVSTLDEMLAHMAKWQRYKPEACAALQAALGGEEFRELVRDAERYRHLREKYVRYEYETSEFNPRSRILHFRFNHLCDQTLDEAVEASIAATKGES